MEKSLVIVESPTKARTLSRFLGSDTKVVASMGHVRDLPENRLGVDVDNGYQPSYTVTNSGKKAVATIRREAKNADAVYLATDHDREGEAIAWHLHEILKDATKAEFHRVTFHEITKSAILEAFDHPSSLDFLKVDAQQARRVLDRIVGYKVSPLLWRSIRRGTSAGRVQSVALRLVCERERAIQAFEPVEYWDLVGHFAHSETDGELVAKLTKIDGKKPKIGNQEEATNAAAEIESADAFTVVTVTDKPRSRKAPPPFITSTLQQTAGSQLGFSTRQAMQLAQQLYEGIELGKEGPTGLITYMRTDSVTVAQEAQNAARDYIRDQFGADYVPERPNRYRSRGGAQEAHEAIRPTDTTLSPDKVAPHLSPQQLRMYRLIWRRFVASQMVPARFLDHIVELEPRQGSTLSHQYLFHTRGSSLTFAGFLKVYGNEGQTGGSASSDAKKANDSEQTIPGWAAEGTDCALRELERNQCFTKPPQRFSEATLVRELERNGVGRPSTYASIVSTIQQREYVSREKGRLLPSELGMSVNDYLMDKLDSLFNIDFTARMEKQLDQIEDGEIERHAMLDRFYHSFQEWLGSTASPSAPDSEAVKAFLEAFPDEDVPWDPPEQRGRRTFDDAKFFRSLNDQIDKGKTLSDKQWLSLLRLASKYADRVPAIKTAAQEAGVGDQLEAVHSAAQEAEQQAQKNGGDAAKDTETLAQQRALIEAFADVTFAKPVKRGNRQYDDAKFLGSLREQVESGRTLSDAQMNALRKMAVKYRQQLRGYEELKSAHNLGEIEGDDAPSLEQAKDVLAITGDIDVWAKPVTRGRRKYNDEEFVKSLTQQAEEGRALTARQFAALKKLIQRYAPQIPDYDAKADRLGLPKAQSPQEAPAAACPRCGGKLATRRGKNGPFIGCSNFPRCRFTARSAEDVEAKREQESKPAE